MVPSWTGGTGDDDRMVEEMEDVDDSMGETMKRGRIEKVNKLELET